LVELDFFHFFFFFFFFEFANLRGVFISNKQLKTQKSTRKSFSGRRLTLYVITTRISFTNYLTPNDASSSSSSSYK